MKNKKRENKTSNFLFLKESWERKSILLVGIMAFALLIGIMLISALTTEEQNALVNELNSLENELSNNGHGWVVNYSANKLINNFGEIRFSLSLFPRAHQIHDPNPKDLVMIT